MLVEPLLLKLCRKLRLSNEKINKTIVSVDGAMEALQKLGWVRDETDADFLIVEPGKFFKMDEVTRQNAKPLLNRMG